MLAKHQLKPKSSRKKKWLYVFVPIALGLAFLIYFVPPDFALSLFTIHFSILILFFALLFFFIFSLTTFIFKSKSHGILIPTFVITYLLFRLTNLTNPFFLLILIALFVVLELFLSLKM